jgi:ubiquinol-cytochrome c reductase cytochrome c1 subunit
MKTKTTFLLAAALMTMGSLAYASEAVHPPEQEWPHKGPLGSYDKAALQRGFQVYKEVCSACHSLKYLSYRNLEALGYTPEQVKSLAAEYTVTDGPNDEGEMFDRPARPSDRFHAPFKNDNAARAANGGALPPDLSLIVKARNGGENYVYGLLTGYGEPPAGTTVNPGMHWNKYFPGHQIAMAPPLMDGQVTRSDGHAATLDEAARDVTQFLAWAAEPHADERKQMGWKVLLYLGVFAGIMYAAKRKVWKDLH